MSNIDFYIKVGDRKPSLEAVLEDAIGPVDLTGAAVKWQMRLQGQSALKVDAVATVVSPAAGSVRYDWEAADTDTAGIFEGEWEVTFGDGKQITFPNWKHLRVMVLDDVD